MKEKLRFYSDDLFDWDDYFYFNLWNHPQPKMTIFDACEIFFTFLEAKPCHVR